jgi:Flp pilus assembly protein TadD
MVSTRETEKGLAAWREGIRLNPKSVPLLTQVAWILATHPDPAVRNADEAVSLAKRAADASGEQGDILDTLGAAYAAAGRFPEAIAAARRAEKIAASQGDMALANEIHARIKLYQSGLPYRQSKKPPAERPLQP